LRGREALGRGNPELVWVNKVSIAISAGVKFYRQKSELLAKDKQCSSKQY
jgi:hypothetical protein